MKDSTAKPSLNQQLLQAIFGDNWVKAHVASFRGDPALAKVQWVGRLAGRGPLAPGNQYFTISIFRPINGRAVRSKENFAYCAAVVIDDVREKIPVEKVVDFLSPSWILRTSVGSEQWGYIFAQPCSDQNIVNNLLEGFVKVLSPDEKDTGMLGVTRYVRLPEGHNAKPSRLIDGKPFDCELLEFEPDRKYTPEQLAEPFGIDLHAERKDSRTTSAADVEHPLLDVVDVKNKIRPGAYRITCPWADEHTDKKDDGAAIWTNSDLSIGFKCHHGHCSDRNGKDLLEHVEEENPRWNVRFEAWKIDILHLDSPKSFDEVTVTEDSAPTPPVACFMHPQSKGKNIDAEKLVPSAVEKYKLLNPYEFKDKVVLKNSVKIKGTLEDLIYMLGEYKITVERNQITKNMDINNPTEPSLNDSQSVMRIISLTIKNLVPRKEIVPALGSIADSNPINPVVDYLKDLEHSSSGHIQRLAECVDVEIGTERIRDKVFRMWMVMACAAADHAESTPNKEAKPKFNSIMIFFGDQGIKKTMFFEAMLPQSLKKYFIDGLSIDPTDKDSIAECIGFWVVEASEIDGLFKKIDISRFKAFLSKSMDILRRPYEIVAQKYQRRTVFVAATNEREFLKDYTGNRRYWPLSVRKIRLPSEKLVDNAWAEAWAAYIDGEQWWPDETFEKMLKNETMSYQIPLTDEPVNEVIRDLIEAKKGVFKKDVVKLSDIKTALESSGLTSQNIDKIPTLTLISKIMKQHDMGLRVRTKNNNFWIIRNFDEYEKMKKVDIEKYYNSPISAPLIVSKKPPLVPNESL